MERTGDDAYEPPKGRGVVEPGGDLTTKGVRRDPTKGTEEASARTRSRFSKLENALDLRCVAALERKHRHDEKLAGPSKLIELSPRDREPGVPGDAETVGVSLDTLF